MPRSEAIRDPIHGYIALTPLEMRGLDGAAMQRLRRIAQLGLTELVFPGARHSRFEHAVGALAVVTRIFEELRDRVGLDGWLPRIDRDPTSAEWTHLLAVARWVALLHDVGHAPFSHVTESLLPPGETHEDRSLRIVRDGDLRRVIAEGGVQLLEDVLVCLDPRTEPSDPALVFVRETIAGPLGADRMDYLLRDSWGTGVSYGIFDLERIVHTLVPIEDPKVGGVRLGVDRGGVSATEGMLWARLSMFGQVYTHHTRRILDQHLREFLGEILPGGRYPAEDDEYLAWNDVRIWEAIRTAVEGGDAPGAANARRILRREHHRVLPMRLEGGDTSAVGTALDEWCAELRTLDPSLDPRGDLVVIGSDPSRGAELPVRLAGEEVVPLREVSTLLDHRPPQPSARLYVTHDARERAIDLCESSGCFERAQASLAPRH